ncbi:MAG: fibronectin type III domain-containing protein, partial [Pseudolysinimonas sp.]
PGRIAQVQLTANDSDPQSAPIKVSSKLIDVPAGISVKVVDKQYAVITAPDKVMSFSFRYELTNDRGGRSVSYVQVQVDPKAPLLPPTATDYVLQTAAIAGKKNVQIQLFPNYAFNPAGLTNDLDVTFLGPNAKSAELLSKPGVVRITPGPQRQAIAYKVTNKKDDLSAVAFILVPAAVGQEFDDPPVINPDLPQQYIPMNSTGTWDLKDIVFAPSGRDVIITSESTVSGIQGTGNSYVDKDTITLTPPKDYRGPAAIVFEVTDGASPDDPKGNKATLRLPIIVGDPEFKDTPPVFTPPSVKLEPGEPVTIDLRASTQHPNPSILQQVTYSDVTVSGSGLTQSLNGSQLTLSVPRNAVKGTTYTLGVTLRWDKFVVPGTVNVTIVASSKPLAVAVNDDIKAQRGGATVTVPVLDNDSNPYQTTGEPLKVIDAHLESDGGSQSSAAVVSFTGTTVSVKPGPGYIGDVTVVYVVQDATQDPDRNVNGRLVVTVRDVPDAPAAPGATGNDAAAYVSITAPNTSNGEPVDGYEVTYTGTHWNGAGSGTQSNTVSNCAPPGCTISGLNNGWSYNFAVRAHNALGWSGWSPSSNTAIPYGTPSQVTNMRVSNPGGYAPATTTWAWDVPGGATGQTVYHWTLTGPNAQSGDTASTSISVGGLSAGTHSMTVYAYNPGPKNGPASAPAALTVSNPPPPPETIVLTKGAFEPSTSNAYYYHVSISGFSGNVGLVCYHRNGQAITGTVYTHPNGWSGDLPCYSGFGNYYVIGNGNVYSNTVGAWQ